MNNEYQFSASELIHLFVDGEADIAQQALLFSLLAIDAGLQEQFRSAVLMQQTIAQVRASAVPPEHYTAGLFAKAGFTAAQPSATWLAGISTTAKNVVLSLFSAVVGACIATLLLFPYIDKATPGPRASMADTALHQQLSDSSTTETYAPTPAGQSTISGGTAPIRQADRPGGTARIYSQYNATPTANRASASLSPIELPTPTTSENLTQKRPDTPMDEEAIHASIDEETPIAQTDADAANKPVEILADTPLDNAMAENQTENAPETPIASITTAPIAQQQIAAIDRSRPQRIAPAQMPAVEQLPMVTLYLKNIQALRWYPVRDIPASTIEENLMFGGLYHLSREHAVGAEVGRELLPLYSFTDSSQIRMNILLWAGGVYQYQPEELAIANTIEPFVRIGLGGTGAGPMGKAMLGIRLQTSNVLSAALGVESSTLVYRRGTKLNTTGKLGFTVSIEAKL